MKHPKSKKVDKHFATYYTAKTSAEARDILERGDNLVLVRRGIARSVWLRCPCDCGAVLSINVDPRIRRHWKIREKDGRITLLPSIWRESGCKTHFILWNNDVLMCFWTKHNISEQEIVDYVGEREADEQE